MSLNGVESQRDEKVEELLKRVLERLERIESRLNQLEEIVSKPQQPGSDSLAARTLALALKLVKAGGAAVDLAWAASRLAKLQPLLLKAGDEISRAILEIIALKGPMNITALTGEVRKYRGTASRRIVASRVKQMSRSGLLKVVEKGREKVVDLPE